MIEDLAGQIALELKLHLRPPDELSPSIVQNYAACVWACAIYDRCVEKQHPVFAPSQLD